MHKSVKTCAIVASIALFGGAASVTAQDHSDHSAETATEDAAGENAGQPEVTVDSYVANCSQFLDGMLGDIKFSPETPTVMRFSMSLHPGADAKALWEANAGGVPAGLVEHGQGFQDGDTESQRDRLEEGAARYLVWPDHEPMYVYAAERVGDIDAAKVVTGNVCELGRKGLYLKNVNTFTILSEYIAPAEQ